MVPVPPGTYAHRQGILLTVVSRPRCSKWVPALRQEFIPCLPCAPTCKLQVAGHSRGNNNELFVKHLENF